MTTYHERRCKEDPAYQKAHSLRGKSWYAWNKANTPGFLEGRAEKARRRRADPFEREAERETEKEKLKNPDYRKQRNARSRKCYQKRANDPIRHAVYLENNRAYRKKEYRENPEYRQKCIQRPNCEPAARLRKYRNDAKQANRPFELSREEAYALFEQDCFYCGEPSKDDQLMGIDRFDNARGYILGNVVPACWTCNVFKHKHAWVDIKQHLHAIAVHSAQLQLDKSALFQLTFRGDPILPPIRLSSTVPFNPRGYKVTLLGKTRDLHKRAKTANYAVTLTNDEIQDHFQSNCTYCNATPNPFNGIDRVDNDLPYTPENSVPCCKICNIAKQALSREEFLAHVQRMLHHDAPIHLQHAFDACSRP